MSKHNRERRAERKLARLKAGPVRKTSNKELWERRDELDRTNQPPALRAAHGLLCRVWGRGVRAALRDHGREVLPVPQGGEAC